MVGDALMQEMVPDIPGFWNELASESHTELEESTLAMLRLEEVIFILHLFDRVMFLEFGAENRDVFMDALYQEVRERLSREYVSGMVAAAFRDLANETYNARQTEYGAYKLFPDKQEGSLRKTLFWEYTKKMFLTAGLTNPALMVVACKRALGLFDIAREVVDKCIKQ